MITILEGTDGVGKTTLALWMAERLSAAIVHYGVPEPGMNNELRYELPILSALEAGNGEVVLDRSFIGSVVWSELGFHDPTMDDLEFRRRCHWYAQKGCVVHVMVRPDQEIWQVSKDRQEDATSRGNSMIAQTEFMRLVKEGAIMYMPVVISTSAFMHRED